MNERKRVPPMPPKPVTPPRTFPVLSLGALQDIIEAECGNVCVAQRHGKGSHKVVVLPEAYQEFRTIVSYGRRSPMNVCEQKLEGRGHIFWMDEAKNVLIVVSHFIQIPTTNRSPVHVSCLGPNGEPNPGMAFLEYYREEFSRLEKECNTDAYGFAVDPLLDRFGGTEFVMEAHTHPGLSCFYSSPDRQTGRARAATCPVCNFVCDPIRREMLGSVGPDFSPAEVIVYDRCPVPPEADIPGKAADTPRKELAPPAEEIARLAAQCLRKRGWSGKLRMRQRMDGRVRMKLRLDIPKTGKEWKG